MLIVMCGRKVAKLGGQDRRWLKVSQIILDNYEAEAVINESYYKLANKTEILISNKYKILKELAGKNINYLWLNINIILCGMKHRHLHYCGNALEMTPSALILRYFFRKKISFSFNGVSVNYLKSTRQWKSVLLLRVMNYISEKIELLNPRLLAENFFDENKIFISKPMYAGGHIEIKKKLSHKKIVFSGHLYDLKGVNLLKEIIKSCPSEDYVFCIYGAIVNNSTSGDIEDWVKSVEMMNNVHFMSHVDNMGEAYADALLVLSLQKISNYPSQVVMEGLASGASVLITDTGDSKYFGNIPGVFYIEAKFDSIKYWRVIDEAINFSANEFEVISRTSFEIFNPKNYADNFIKNINLIAR